MRFAGCAERMGRKGMLIGFGVKARRKDTTRNT
jgi:hypothetical protein